MPDYTVSTTVAKEERRFGTHVNTTDATVTTVATLYTNKDKIYTVTAVVNGMTTDVTTGQASYVLVGLFKNVAGTLTQVGSTTVVSSIETDAAWDCAFAIVAATATATAAVAVKVTGVAATNIVWHAQVDTVQGQLYAAAFGTY